MLHLRIITGIMLSSGSMTLLQKRPGVVSTNNFLSPSRLHSVPPKRALQGMPSTPGWRKGQLDTLTDWAVNDKANRPVICEYEPDALWLWTRWRGTVLKLTIVPIILVMGLSATIDYGVHSLSATSWPLLSIPPADHPLIQQLQGLNSLWEYQLTLCTFILTFFTSQAYSHWRSVYFTTRAIQGRINDICLLVAIGAERENCADDQEGGYTCTTRYSDSASQLVETCSRLIRLSHTFFWAATPTCSNGVSDGGFSDDDDFDDSDMDTDMPIGPLLLSSMGLRGLADNGELTKSEVNALLDLGLPPSQYTYVLMEWVGLHVMEGLKSGTLCGDNGFEENLLRQFTSLRAEYFNIGDYSAGRIPLAYVQLVQVLVDTLIIIAPFALYPELGSLSIPLSGFLTFFFKGLLELSKSFLDPFGNEGYPGQNIRVDVLVSELNFGAASRWVKAGEKLPSDKY
mmetsp:Transcript_8704/g.13350  ORF Transcript_8704/g.13350 Transcript_8704/m.13350 type:complete len:456 (-) Transcript_8704:334-1701(-)